MKRKIKIVHVLPMLSIGGAERVVFNLLEYLDRDKFEVKLVCFQKREEKYNTWKKELLDNNISYIILDSSGKKGKLFLLMKLIKVLKEDKPDIVHTHLFLADVLGRVAAKIAGIKIIVNTEHNVNNSFSRLHLVAKIISNFFSDCHVAVSEAVCGYLKNIEWANDKMVRLIYNGIKVEKFLFPERIHDHTERVVICAVGRLSKQKGYDILVEALAQIKNQDFLCLIAGDDDPNEIGSKSKLEQLIIDSGLVEKIKLVGVKEKTEDFYKEADIFVMSSRWEGLPLVLLEAGASGLPVVAPAVGGIGEVINNGLSGLLFDGGNASQLASGITELLVSPEKRLKFGNALKVRIENDFGLNKMINEYEKIYIELINKIK